MDSDLSDILFYLKANQPGLFLEEGDEEVAVVAENHLQPITLLLLQCSPSLVNDLLNVMQRGNLTKLTKLQYVVDKLQQRFMALNAYDLINLNTFSKINHKGFVLKEANLLLSMKLDDYINDDENENENICADYFKQLFLEQPLIKVNKKMKPCILWGVIHLKIRKLFVKGVVDHRYSLILQQHAILQQMIGIIRILICR